MKKINTYLILFCLAYSIDAIAQIDGAKSKIATIGRYTSKGTELRWIPDNKTILQLGFKNGFTIERSEAGRNQFENIATIKPFEKTKWEQLITEEKDTTTKSNLELAMEFLFAENEREKSVIDLEAGIATLNEMKSKEDMVYAIFLFTVIKEAKVAEALGLSYTDQSVLANKVYTYKIKLNAKSKIYSIEDGVIDIRTFPNKNQYQNEVFVFAGDKELSFAWKINTDISGYFVERAAEGETNFKPLNTTAFYVAKGQGYEGNVNGTFKDDSLTNYKWYRYRFYGNTAFGEKVLFAEVKGMPKDLTPPDAPILKLPKQIKPNEVLVEWDIYGNTSDLKGFIIARSQKDSGEFKILHKSLLSNKTRKYVDTEFNTQTNNYYVVYALDTAGNISASYPGYVTLIDSTPPEKPEIISAIIDSVGIVKLKIKLGKEKDLKGYRIYKANSAEHELSVIEEFFKKDKSDTTSIKLIYNDTVGLNSLTSKIYYRVKALDFNYNQSPFSDISIVKRPDTIPPTTPVFTNVIVKEKQVELYFAPSESRDVAEQIIYRKTDMNADWNIILKLSPDVKMAIDTNVKTGVLYYYSLRAKDESNLFSKYANTVTGKPFDTGVRLPIINLTSNVQDKKVVLKWDYPKTEKEVFFVIYKKDLKGQLLQYARVKEKIFIDNNSGKENTYTIKVITKDGGQSILSKLVTQRVE